MSAIEVNGGVATVESVALVAQTYLADRPLIVLGSGASVAHGLPGMGPLAHHILRTIGPRTRSGDDQTAWAKFSDLLNRTQDLERSLSEAPLSNSLLSEVIAETWSAISEPDLKLHEQLVSGRTALPLTRYLRHLLRTANPNVSVVTTNYDRLAEYAADLAETRASTGFEGGWIQHFDDAALKVGTGSRPRIQVFKPHGSLDWFLDRSGEVRAVPLPTAIPPDCQPLIVTPGISKYQKTHADPFRTVTALADESLKRAASFLCIGYGFGDEHIHPVLRRRIRTDRVPIVVLARTLTSSARSVVVDAAVPRFLAIEARGTDAKIYCPQYRSGVVLHGSELWKLSDFLNLVLGPESDAP